ncbi:uncharacterized protein LOC144600532 isoform X2 [Rhinoraja longicauda]
MQKTKLNPLLRKNKAVENARKKDVEVGGYIMTLLKEQKRKRKMQQEGAKQIGTIIGIGILAVLIVATCPLLCCLIMQKTKLNPLLRKNKAVENARKKDVEVGGYIMTLLKEQKRKRKMQQEGAKQIGTIIGIGILAVLIVATCPLLCCLIMQKTKLNPLLRKNKAVENARKKDVEVGGYIMTLLKEQKRKRKMQQEDEAKLINNEDQ